MPAGRQFCVCYKIIVLVLQKEFAERLIAKPGSKNYGRLTVTVGYRANIELLDYISKENFYPQPKVDSAIIRIKPKKTIPRLVYLDDSLYSQIMKLYDERTKKKGEEADKPPLMCITFF